MEDEEGNVLLSPQLMTDGEIDEVVNKSKRELDEFGRAAKEELRNLKEKMRS